MPNDTANPFLFDFCFQRALPINNQDGAICTKWSTVKWKYLHTLVEALKQLVSEIYSIDENCIETSEYIDVKDNYATAGVRVSLIPHLDRDNVNTSNLTHIAHAFIQKTVLKPRLDQIPKIEDKRILELIDTAANVFREENGNKAISSPIRLVTNTDSDATSVVISGRYAQKPPRKPIIPESHKDNAAIVDCLSKSDKTVFFIGTEKDASLEYDEDVFFFDLAESLLKQTPISIEYEYTGDAKSHPLWTLTKIIKL